MRSTFAPTFAAILLCGFIASCTTAQDEKTKPDDEPKQVHAGGGVHPKGKPNRLAKESSPYLLLHAHNPVDWYPWGPEAFDKAKKENKIIFLSVGYSSCYWCHVMEREVFSNPQIAKFMNENFVNIKVDREERPDIDDIYMTGLRVYNQLAGSNRGGGWPLSMFLTPDGNPIAGATYLPPEDSPERGPSFPTVANKVLSFWKNEREGISQLAQQIAAAVQRATRPGIELNPVELNAKLLTGAIEAVKERYDSTWGGVDFNPNQPASPRFPNVPRLQMTLDVYESTGDEALLKIVTHSLQRMAHGGIRDHLGGGFHRYSTDRRWHVPHFEKMLYDQAMLLSIYSRAAALKDNAEFREVAAEVAQFITNEMTTKEGAFCSALDAETNAIEGEYYVWSQAEVKKVLGDESDLFAEAYGLNADNPFEHGYVLHLPKPLAEVAKANELSAEECNSRLHKARTALLKARSERERPLLDDKVLTSWNALMIRSLAESGRLLERPQDIAAASKAAEFLLTELTNEKGELLRTWRNGEAKYQAYLEDYAFLVAALLELHKANGEQRWLDEAAKLASLQNKLFYDEALQAFYYTASNHEKLIARTSNAYDSVFPSANSVSVRNLLTLSRLLKKKDLQQTAHKTLSRFASTLRDAPAGCAGLARALHMWLDLDKAEDGKTGLVSPARHWILTGLSDDRPAAVQQISFRPVIPTQQSPLAQNNKVKPVKVKVYPLYNKLPKGGRCPVAIELSISRGWHINANPANPDFLVPTKVELKTKQKVKLKALKYPKHHELKVDGFDKPYHVYDGKVMIYGILEIDNAQTADVSELEFHVNFQGCNSQECLPPDKVIMRGKLQFAAQGTPLKKVNATHFPKPQKDEAKERPEKRDE